MSNQSSPIDGVPPHAAAVPGVIRRAAAAAAANHSPTITMDPGYSPKLSLDMASAHTWAPYEATLRALRCLALTSLTSSGSREKARDTILELYCQGKPFSNKTSYCYDQGPGRAARRFPDDEVHVCLDRAPFSRRMQGILEPLARAEAAAEQGEELVRACSAFFCGIGDALDELTRVVVEGDAVASAVLYDRATFESAFLLTWTGPQILL